MSTNKISMWDGARGRGGIEEAAGVEDWGHLTSSLTWHDTTQHGLWKSAAFGNTQGIAPAIQLGADVNAKNYEHCSWAALHYSAAAAPDNCPRHAQSVQNQEADCSSAGCGVSTCEELVRNAARLNARWIIS
eukprot:3494326-Rhodomonas_salina.2